MKTMHMIGNAHIDPVWLWQWQEGYQETKATFRSALDRMKETDDFVFTCACADAYRWVEESDPDMFMEIQERVAQGRWVITGGMWVQPDMNLPSGESLCRHLLYSQRYFLSRFGMTPRVGYNVDSFGHNAMTPQFLRRAGMDAYVWMRPSAAENPSIPEGAMVWEAPDGSQVRTYRIFGEYVCFHDVPGKVEKMAAFSQRIGQPVMCFYGVGNHGGGPTMENLREIATLQKASPLGTEVVYSSPVRYFTELAAENIPLPVWRDELQHHASGCYSTHSQSKKLHRRAENALLRAERLAVLARELVGHPTTSQTMTQGWRNLMLNEFHDVMGGCCLEEALEDVRIQLSESISIAAREENAALQCISWKVDTAKGYVQRVRTKEWDGSLWSVPGHGTPIVVFNPHGFEAEGTILVRRPIRAVQEDEGHFLPVQAIRASRTNWGDIQDGIFRARVPAMGYKLFWLGLEEAGVRVEDPPLSVSETHLENAHIRAEFDAASGALCHFIRKEDGVDALSGLVQAKLMDIEACDTWAHNVFAFDNEAGTFGDACVTVLEEGPVRAVLQVVTHFGASTLSSRYILYAGADQLEVETSLDMQERQRLVKLCFPTPYFRDIAQIPYGVLPRTADGLEQPCQKWVVMEGEDGGLAILNDCKYSYSAHNGELRLTVAHTSIFADHYGQTLRDDSCRYMDIGEQSFRYVLVPYAGDWQAAGLTARADVLNMPLSHVVETYHAGILPGSYCGFSCDVPQVSLGAIKLREDMNGYVLRLTETSGHCCDAHIRIPLLDRNITLSFTPYEIKTVSLPFDVQLPPEEVLLTEEPCISHP